jgi:hypothetical protein
VRAKSSGIYKALGQNLFLNFKNTFWTLINFNKANLEAELQELYRSATTFL